MRGCCRIVTGLFIALAQVAAPGNVEAQDPGFVRVAPNGRYFAFEDGTPFFGISIYGHEYIDSDSPMNRLGYEAYFKYMNRNGINNLRIMMDNGDYLFEQHNKAFPLPNCGEYPDCITEGVCKHPKDPRSPGYSPVYDAAVKETLTYLFGLADKYDIYIEINPFFTANMALHPTTHPFFSNQGGPISRPLSVAEFYSNPKAMCLAMRRYAWLADNFGNETHLLAWDMANEMDMKFWGASAEQINPWIDAMVAFMRSVDPNHLITISTTNPWADLDHENPEIRERAEENLLIWNPDPPYDDFLDIATFHVGYDLEYYDSAVSPITGIDAVQAQVLCHTALREQVIPSLSPIRPVMVNEVAQFSRKHWNLYPGWTADMMADYFRMTRWAHMASGSATSSNPFVTRSIPGGLKDKASSTGWMRYYFDEYDSLRVISQFARAVDWARADFTGEPADDRIRARDIYTMATADSAGSVIVAWLLRVSDTPLPANVSVNFSNLKNERHQILFYNDRTGRVEGAYSRTGRSFSISVPGAWFGPDAKSQGWQHTAILVRPYRAGYTDIFPQQGDTDHDGVIDFLDNCPGKANPNQGDSDRDGTGDVCDNCARLFNRLQADFDEDGTGDECEPACAFGADGEGVFIVDPENGLNSNNGRQGTPWRTVEWAENNVCPGATILLSTCGDGGVQTKLGEICDPPGSACGQGCGSGRCGSNCLRCISTSPSSVAHAGGIDNGADPGTMPAGTISGAASFLLPLSAVLMLYPVSLKIIRKTRPRNHPAT